MNLPRNIFNVFSLDATLVIITWEVLKGNSLRPNQIPITWNEAFAKRGSSVE